MPLGYATVTESEMETLLTIYSMSFQANEVERKPNFATIRVHRDVARATFWHPSFLVK